MIMQVITTDQMTILVKLQSIEIETNEIRIKLGDVAEKLKKLDAEIVESSLGKLECKGVTGTTEFPIGGRKNVVTFTNRLHKKAPFGIVSSEMQIAVSRDGQAERNMTMRITLSKVGKDAKSELPDSN